MKDMQKRDFSTSAAPCVPNTFQNFWFSSNYDLIHTCTLNMTLEIKPRALHYWVNVCLQEKGLELNTAAMVDSGATVLFLDEGFVRKHKIPTFLMKRALPIYNIALGASQYISLWNILKICWR